ncbi:bifunctional glutamate N-acetyltransferase/amino-acid acetyltransferase ArgJ [Dehalococcoides mccartyi]|jgi:glutamate N-acetyltransferase/amino-acid N-acetyltransferase|uniref:Arginine biosynthesis bifunctional protein ArgJ n=1 Tax=Dehalococcoides mccartyi TaxID=61435 RepID=A0A142VB64_9CHLR|nr:bifunctional glutamate N-acetyltransferase/amino-acid acetyltransferase ArgJ [Dehalococcoides mccartyi]AII61214.1 ornithine acetyltransferase [Dehalococcoides mccartyi CG5]AMU86909.1 glutamate N-acetyltransferase / amino-acid N-acetyltransferase [Dehalococcoides mccartyi]AOV99699.1 glutamate n-acetyltransferase [Dehalococcoides mccartyi]MBA2085478.1 Glutamate N-acetyltransferase, N-acetylglutamate synthase [Dehalococcoides mccartyi]QBX64230.1 bifunctional glutamate N-acetyltransferase/amino
MKSSIDILPDGSITTPKGFKAGAIYAGIKKKSKNNLDLAILYSDTPCIAAGIFTTNKFRAAPVYISEHNLGFTDNRAIVVNSGCANAGTGEAGMADAIEMVKATAESLNMQPKDVLIASTGVIGHRLPIDKIKENVRLIGLSQRNGHEFARAIMTTDTRSKEIAVQVNIEGFQFYIAGAAKGAGMIHPNMATMLGFITTDASVSKEFLQFALKEAADVSFNMITVDGDTSTNDSLFMLSNGQAENPTFAGDTEYSLVFQQALTIVCQNLAKSIARDGEGAKRLIEIQVEGAANLEDARLIARVIAGSPLVKTAVHGADPNWGRILAAAGRAGADFDIDMVDLYLGESPVLLKGARTGVDEKELSSWLRQVEVIIKLNLNLGQGKAAAWGCDLSAEYVKINADYTT